MRHPVRRARLLVFAAGISLPLAAHAAPETHDGFFLRLAGGYGYATFSEQGDGVEVVLKGAAAGVDLAIGGAVTQNLVAHGTIFGSGVREPTVEIDGSEVGMSNASVTASVVGAGLTYYVMPLNLYLSGSLGLAQVSVEANGMRFDTDNGWGVDLVAGKEWWVSENWGLGIAAQITHASVPDRNPVSGRTYDLTSNSFALLFSATFN